jgi:hypothetical protein
LLFSLLLRLFSPDRGQSEPEDPPFTERRKPPYRCAGCRVWTSNLVFLRNGANYCLDCARNLENMWGTSPAGKRTDDITDLRVTTAGRSGPR